MSINQHGIDTGLAFDGRVTVADTQFRALCTEVLTRRAPQKAIQSDLVLQPAQSASNDEALASGARTAHEGAIHLVRTEDFDFFCAVHRRIRTDDGNSHVRAVRRGPPRPRTSLIGFRHVTILAPAAGRGISRLS